MPLLLLKNLYDPLFAFQFLKLKLVKEYKNVYIFMHFKFIIVVEFLSAGQLVILWAWKGLRIFNMPLPLRAF